jgi:hypothetical protein
VFAEHARSRVVDQQQIKAFIDAMAGVGPRRNGVHPGWLDALRLVRRTSASVDSAVTRTPATAAFHSIRRRSAGKHRINELRERHCSASSTYGVRRRATAREVGQAVTAGQTFA